jgi:hypothetical protein
MPGSGCRLVGGEPQIFVTLVAGAEFPDETQYVKRSKNRRYNRCSSIGTWVSMDKREEIQVREWLEETL